MKKTLNVVKRFANGLSENNLNAHAAASAFYMFMSLVPFVALISAIIPYTGLREETLLYVLSRYLPDALDMARKIQYNIRQYSIVSAFGV